LHFAACLYCGPEKNPPAANRPPGGNVMVIGSPFGDDEESPKQRMESGPDVARGQHAMWQSRSRMAWPQLAGRILPIATAA
jgi:hypothetical protein